MKYSERYQRQFNFIDTEAFFENLKGKLDERTYRLVVAAMAEAGGHFNLTHIARCASVSRPVIYSGIEDLKSPPLGVKRNGEQRQRKRGGGRKSLLEKFPALRDKIKAIVEPHTRGNPGSPLLWVSKSLVKIRNTLNAAGQLISDVSVGKVLRAMGYTLQSCKKSHEHADSPNRDAQFRNIASMISDFQSKGQPVISVDTKKKELIGNFKNAGREYHPQGAAPIVEVHDFVTEAGRATPYGVYDITNNEAFVNVGTWPDTAEFAVESIRKWWEKMGRARYPDARSLYITADGGGSNGSRNRLWKKSLKDFAMQSGLLITVSHYPPGTSKWNKIEHRLFAFISQNWRGKPLTSIDVIVNLIANTTNSKGLRVVAEASTSNYATGIKVTDKEMKALGVKKHELIPEWNYTISPN